jgi:hypothetical protein
MLSALYVEISIGSKRTIARVTSFSLDGQCLHGDGFNLGQNVTGRTKRLFAWLPMSTLRT